MRVLVVEDQARLAKAVAEGLRPEGMAVDVSLDGADALTHVAINTYDVVVLNRDLPGVHGDQVCRRLVDQHSSTRVLMLTEQQLVELNDRLPYGEQQTDYLRRVAEREVKILRAELLRSGRTD